VPSLFIGYSPITHEFEHHFWVVDPLVHPELVVAAPDACTDFQFTVVTELDALWLSQRRCIEDLLAFALEVRVDAFGEAADATVQSPDSQAAAEAA
jgi:hypothetical protein